MTVGDAITKYIAHQRYLGKRFRSEGAILTAFRKSIGNMPLCDICPAIITKFLDREGPSDETVRKKRRTLERFFRFAVARHLLKASPMPQYMRKLRPSSFTPYIYSDAELKGLLKAVPLACGRRSHIDGDTLHAFLLLLYGAGLRRSEALHLKLSDFDGPQSLIHVHATKFFKSRIVPMGADVKAVIQAHLAKRCKRGPIDLDSLLFCKRNGEPVTGSAVAAAFRRLRTIAGIRRDGGSRRQPRLHDLRHSAAVHRVIAWYRQGADMNDLLPKLATYLGHNSLSGTQRYLTMTQELLAEASLRFEAFARRGNHV
jgi:integrase/recombinase XerD